MKRDYPYLHPPPPAPALQQSPMATADSPSSISGCPAMASKGKLWAEEPTDGGMDELLAVLGYKVRSSDMAEVAKKLEQLEEAVMGNNVHQEDITATTTTNTNTNTNTNNKNNNSAVLSHLSTDTVHYNPSDLSSWLETMLSELNDSTAISPTLDYFFASNSSNNSSSSTSSITGTISAVDFPTQKQYNGDLKAIPGEAVLSTTTTAQTQLENQRRHKRIKHAATTTTTDQVLLHPNSTHTSSSSSCSSTESTRPVVLVDSQENGVRLVHLLLACAEAVERNNLTLAEALVKEIGCLAVSQAGAMRKVATFFAEALARRIYRVYPQNSINHSMSDVLQMHFYETCPYLKFAHFTANQAILEALEGQKRVHVVDFSMNRGMQWPALMQALALRPGGPPAFRLTGIGPPSPDNSDYLQQVGCKLAQLANTIHIEFEYRGFVANSLADLDSSVLELRSSDYEAVAVNSILELHKLLARPGAIDKVLKVVKEMKPEIVTVVEQEANHNGSGFLDRFTESLHYYSTLFDSLEGSVSTQGKLMSEVYLGKQICNVVACEGADRVERHETSTQWRTRFGSAGFVPIHLGSNAFKQASMLASYAGGEGYRVEENNGCLMLGWHTRPLISTSAWRLA